MLKAVFTDYKLNFLKPSGTSRGILYQKPSWFLKVWDIKDPSAYGIGECAPIEGLSIDPISFMNQKLEELTENINNHENIDLKDYPSIQFGLETALLDLKNGGEKVIFKNQFSKGHQEIYINGLIWMGNKESMIDQVKSKIDDGFRCLKLKIGAIDFDEELSIIQSIRKQFNKDELELRLDANGAFDLETAKNKLNQLSKYHIHSIEQPIYPGQFDKMKALCLNSPIPIALDEELISIKDAKKKEDLISYIKPQYIILKPGLLGGFKKTQEWINAAEKNNISWWITSALESNIGLNAIAQFTAQFKNPLPQGLGTGKIYTNNIPSFLELNGEHLKINNELNWNDSMLTFK